MFLLLKEPVLALLELSIQAELIAYHVIISFLYF